MPKTDMSIVLVCMELRGQYYKIFRIAACFVQNMWQPAIMVYLWRLLINQPYRHFFTHYFTALTFSSETDAAYYCSYLS
jgi:hypothetical protein